MAIKYKNTKGEDYYIKMKLTKKGNSSYYMTRKSDEDCLSEIPNGYEVFERYDTGVMFIRKKKELKFNATQIQLIQQELTENKSVSSYKLDLSGTLIKIYTIERGEASPFSSTSNSFFGTGKPFPFSRFEERMRIYKKGNMTSLQRYCYRGRIDDWITIDESEDFEEIIKRNLYHLGKESYYNLM